MANLTISEQFDLPADPELVWRHLIDAERIALCLPGAELEEKQSETTFVGSVVVKVGSVRITYRGTVEFEEVDHEGRSMRLRGTGREKTGSGSARMTMSSQVTAGEAGGSTVAVQTDIEIAGKLVRFGRGMIQRLSQEIFKEFVACLATRLKAEAEGIGGGEGASGGPALPTEGAGSPPELRPVKLVLQVLWRPIKKLVRRLLGRGPA